MKTRCAHESAGIVDAVQALYDEQNRFFDRLDELPESGIQLGEAYLSHYRHVVAGYAKLSTKRSTVDQTAPMHQQAWDALWRKFAAPGGDALCLDFCCYMRRTIREFDRCIDWEMRLLSQRRHGSRWNNN